METGHYGEIWSLLKTVIVVLFFEDDHDRPRRHHQIKKEEIYKVAGNTWSKKLVGNFILLLLEICRNRISDAPYLAILLKGTKAISGTRKYVM
jgi:hypothetical protein